MTSQRGRAALKAAGLIRTVSDPRKTRRPAPDCIRPVEDQETRTGLYQTRGGPAQRPGPEQLLTDTMVVCGLLSLLLLFAASAARTVHDACGAVRGSSLELNHFAHMASIQARNGSKDVTDFSSALDWMEAKDMCDPETLRQKPATCLRKMLDVLTSYRSAVERVSSFESCRESVSLVKPAMQKLHEDMSRCVRWRLGTDHHKESHSSPEEVQPVQLWQEVLLCHYTLDRLFSFSILTARVFAVGDPVRHSDGSAQTCT